MAAGIVRYEPSFMTGRHWLFPYVPLGSRWEQLKRAVAWGAGNVRMGRTYFARRASMRRFRKRYLVEKGQRRALFSRHLRHLRYSCYIVGSDQIWNPDITCGLREVYFGAFENRRKEKVVAYGASMGSASLPSEYDRRFSELVRNVDVVSVREEEAIPYIEQFYDGPVTSVLDPVFLLKREEWERIEIPPAEDGYILYYATEANGDMAEFAGRLAKRTGRTVVELRSGAGSADKEFITDGTAGPAEFLGYIHNADYVVTNSFHGTAFSILYQKKFMVFLHRSLGARIRNILRIHGLEDRLYREEQETAVDSPIDWARVERRTERNVRGSEEFLRENVLDSVRR